MIPILLLALSIPIILSIALIIEKHYLNKNIHFQTLLFWATPVALLTAIIFGYIFRDIIREDMKKLSTKDFCIIMFKMFLTMFFVSMLNYIVLKQIKAFELSAIQISAPIFVLLFGYLFLKETINKQQVCGFILALTGLVLILKASSTIGKEKETSFLIVPKLNIQ